MTYTCFTLTIEDEVAHLQLSRPDELNTWQTGMFQPTDMMESFAAKQEKRQPRFQDLTPRRSFDET